MIYSKGYCDSCDTDNCEHANPLRLGRVDQTPQQAAIVKALDERATLLARVAELEAIRDAHADCYECDEDAAMCDCSWHENARHARESHREPPNDVISAAEGVTLEPGRYVEADTGMGLTLLSPWEAKRIASGWAFIEVTSRGPVTAVRRVAPESAAKPPAERLALAARPTAIPRGTTLEVGRWYRITDISANDTGPKHKVGDIVKCDDHSDTGIRRRFADENWFAAALHGGTYVTGLELVPGPDAKKEGA